MISVVMMVALGLLPANPANDNNVFFDGLNHDTASLLYVPNGPRQSLSDDVKLRLRSYQNDLTAATLEYFDGATWTPLPMAYDATIGDLAASAPECGLTFPCITWVATIPGTAAAFAYRFKATDGTDNNYVGAATSGTGCKVFADGLVPLESESFSLPIPMVMDAGMPVDAAVPPDAALPPDAAMPPDAAVAPDAAMPPDAALPPDAAMPPDAAHAPDAAVVMLPDAAVLPDAAPSVSDAAVPSTDAAVPHGDAGSCIPGCKSSSERIICSTSGLPIILACTAGTHCDQGVCAAPPPDDTRPTTQGCSCEVTTGNTVWLAGVALLVWMRVRRRR